VAGVAGKMLEVAVSGEPSKRSPRVEVPRLAIGCFLLAEWGVESPEVRSSGAEVDERPLKK
jgi:hypothetical protein